MDNKSNKNLWIGVVAVVVVLALVFWVMNKKSGVDEAGDQNDSSVGVEDTTEGSINNTVPAAALSYAQALVKYKDARLQIDNTCQASPDAMTFKNSASMMVDNRSSLTRTVKLGSTFTIKPYGFKIVKLYSATLPATWLVDCDKSQNVATITIQK